MLFPFSSSSQRTPLAEPPSIPDLVTFHHPPGRITRPSDIVEAGYRGNIDLVEAAAGSPEAPLRFAALGALLRLDVLDGARLEAFATDPDPSVRRRAAELAPRIPDAGTLEIQLVEMLSDEPEIAEIAAFALGEIGSSGTHVLQPPTIAAIERTVRSHDDALCREAAVAALGALHTGLDTILAACADKATVRRRAIIALAPFEGAEVDAALETALSDRDWQVRQAAEDLSG